MIWAYLGIFLDFMYSFHSLNFIQVWKYKIDVCKIICLILDEKQTYEFKLETKNITFEKYLKQSIYIKFEFTIHIFIFLSMFVACI